MTSQTYRAIQVSEPKKLELVQRARDRAASGEGPPNQLRGFRQKVRLIYDLPSSLMSRLRNEELMVSAGKLDEKLRLLAERSTGAAA